MKALMLAAGVGARLSGNDGSHPPKALLKFGGRTLLARHLDILRGAGIDGLILVTGYRAADIAAEIAALGAGGYISTIHNPDYRDGSMVSLACARDALLSGEDILFMDADVLYDPAIIRRLVGGQSPDCIPYDRDFDAGDEPVKLCRRDGRVVEFRKIVETDYETVGEWPGFVRLSGATAAHLAAAVTARISAGDTGAPCEEAFRDVLLSDAGADFAVLDITGLPWIEIDFPEDVRRAEQEILPLIENA